MAERIEYNDKTQSGSYDAAKWNAQDAEEVKTVVDSHADDIELIEIEKAPIANPTFTGTVSGVTKAMVGLSNVDNTADASKPVSTAQQTALNLKAPIASPTFTGTVSGITKTMVGLGSVDNTADASKPVSSAQAAAIGLKVDKTTTVNNKALSGNINLDKTDIGLSNVDNTSDTNKPISALTANALSEKATPADIESALDATTIFFDDSTFEGAVYPVPVGEEPAVGTEDNPIKAKNAGFSLVNSVANGNMSAVTSNAVYQAIQALLGGYEGTMQDLYNLIASGLPTPEAPTSFIVDDTGNTGDWTNSVDHTDIGDYEYQINGGSLTTATVKPFVVGDVDAAIGAVRIRVKAVVGVSNASAWLSNPTAYTSSGSGANLLSGASLLDILAIKNDSTVDYADGVYTMNAASSFSYAGQAIQNIVANDFIAIKFTADTKSVNMGVVEHVGDYTDDPKIDVIIDASQVVSVKLRDVAPVTMTVQPTIGQWIVCKRLTLSDGSGYSDWEVGYITSGLTIVDSQTFSPQYISDTDCAPRFLMINSTLIEINSPQFRPA